MLKAIFCINSLACQKHHNMTGSTEATQLWPGEKQNKKKKKRGKKEMKVLHF
jgi:hypothetical protein